MSSPTSRKYLRWDKSSAADDFLQLGNPDGSTVGGIGPTGIGYGSLAPGGGTSYAFSNSLYAKQYGVTANGQFVYDAVSNSTNLVSSASANFTQSDVGKIVFGIDNLGAPTSPPQGVITAVISANEIEVSNPSTATKTAVTLGWGTDDSAACEAAWAAAVVADQYLVLPSGFIFAQKALFYVLSGAPAKNYGLMSDGFSSLCPTPNFDFSTLPNGNGGMFFDVTAIGGDVLFPNNTYIANVGVFGGNQKLSGNSVTGSIFNFGQTHAENIWVFVYGYGATNLIAVNATGPTNFNGLYVESAGAIGLKVLGGLTQFVTLYNGSYVTTCSICLLIDPGALLNSYGSEWGPSGTDPACSVEIGGVFNSYGDAFLGGFGYTGARSLDVSGVANLNGCVFSSGNQYGLQINSGGRVFLSGNCSFNLTGLASTGALINSAGIFVDDGSTIYTAGTAPAMVAGDITPSTGWGTSGAAGNGVSNVTGDIRRFQFTVTATGSPSPNPTVVINFPWTQARTPLFICKQVGGTGAIAQVSGEASATTTGMTLTWNGTPQNGDTYIFQCISE